MTIPLWTTGHGIDPISPPLARAALVQLASADRWDNVDHLCRQLRFWNQSSQLTPAWPASQTPLLPLVAWVQDPRVSLTAESVAGVSVLNADLLPPLLVEFGKEAFNTQTELLGDLAEQSYQDAGRIVTSPLTARTPGLVPGRHDRRLFISLPTAITVALPRRSGPPPGGQPRVQPRRHLAGAIRRRSRRRGNYSGSHDFLPRHRRRGPGP